MKNIKLTTRGEIVAVVLGIVAIWLLVRGMAYGFYVYDLRDGILDGK